MTEEEKRALALDFLAAEKQRLKSSTFRDHRAAYEAETHERIASRQQYYDAFAQQGKSPSGSFKKRTTTPTSAAAPTCSPTGFRFSTPRRR